MARQWSLAPVLALRQTGFPLERTEILTDTDLAAEASPLGVLAARARAAAGDVKALFRQLELGGSGRYGSALGQLLPLKETVLTELTPHFAAVDLLVVQRYQRLVLELEAGWSAYQEKYDLCQEVSRAKVVAAFRDDDLLREVLMLSNDKHYPEYAEWLMRPEHDLSSKRGRNMADLLTRYLQRVTTKNETHSHFGPVAAGRFDPAVKGITWETGELQRVGFFSYWAADRLAAQISARPETIEWVRPRRRPWAFRRDDQISLYAFTTETGFAADWRFVHVGDKAVDPAGAWLFDRCDGERTVADLRREFETAQVSGKDVLEVLDELTDAGWVVARFEIAIGEPYPLGAIARQLPAHATETLGIVSKFEALVTLFAGASAAQRPGLIGEMKTEFERVTGLDANRGGGRHYADRSIFFEECHSPVRDLRLGSDVAEFIQDELAPVYEIALIGPRWRLWRENRILAAFLSEQFGDGSPVPMDVFYRKYFEHRPALLAECDVVDGELAAIDRELSDALLSGAQEMRDGATVSSVPLARLEEIIAAHRVPVPAVCNPDVMIAATDTSALAAGDFYAVIGDCHALREILTHTSFTPLIAEALPELTETIYGHYLGLLGTGEVLCDMSRSHPNKTGSQVQYPCPDLEIFGRSPKPRSEVLLPGQLFVVSEGGQAFLRARGIEGNIRLTAPPAGGPSIRQDPLSPFSFPRHFGGIGLNAGHLRHLPRIAHGRVVIHRETWRVPASDLRGRTAAGQSASGDAAEFFAAQQLRWSLGLPRYVFAKVPSEPKPVFVDFDAPLLVRQMTRMARAHGETVTISEMLPSPDKLWLDIDGKRHTSELRCALFSKGTAA